ncbi:MAG TPA: uridine kinase [Acidimicrobiia bacterium]|nr:uridine kinase [Acidimicrobiia bacterium]
MTTHDRPLFVGIAGGSGSGKSTICTALLEALPDLALVQHDAYYRDRTDLDFEERSRLNYDHPDSLETDLLIDHLDRLAEGQPIPRPVYDFSQHLRSREFVAIEPADVVLVEGILVLADKELRQRLDLKIYVDTDPDLRLARRLTRDIEERGRTVDSVLAQYFDTVRPMHLEFVEPSKRYADLIIPEGYNPRAVATVVEMLRARLGSELTARI